MRFLIVGMAIVVLFGCVSPEEIARMQAERAAIVEQRISSVRRNFITKWSRVTEPSVRYAGPQAGEVVAYRYIRDIGGTVVQRGRAEFELQVEVIRVERLQQGCIVKVVARLVDKFAAARTVQILALGEGPTRYSSGCRNVSEGAIRTAVENIE